MSEEVNINEILERMEKADKPEVKKAEDEAPPEVKEAVMHIRAAFKRVNCPYSLTNLRGKGYRLDPPNE